MKRIYSILILILVVLFVAFIIQNAEMVDLTFLIWGIEISKALLMVICASVGFLLGLVVFSFRKASVKSTTTTKVNPDSSEPRKETTSHTPSSH